MVFDNMTLIQVKGQIYECQKCLSEMKFMKVTAKYDLDWPNIKGDIQARQLCSGGGSLKTGVKTISSPLSRDT